MIGASKQIGRLAFRGVWLASEFAYAALAWAWIAATHAADDQTWRACWLHRHSRRLLRVFHCGLTIHGAAPTTGFLVANHLSYLDILVLAAYQPCVFVAKREVRGWPIFGTFARMAATIFVDRQNRADVTRVAGLMKRVAALGSPVVLFPEGTSSDGACVLPFKSALLQPLAGEPCCGAAFLSYSIRDGSVADEVCYWRDMTLLPHLLNLLGKEGLTAELRLSPVDTQGLDRKALAGQLRDAVVTLGKEIALHQPDRCHSKDGGMSAPCRIIAASL